VKSSDVAGKLFYVSIIRLEKKECCPCPGLYNSWYKMKRV